MNAEAGRGERGAWLLAIALIALGVGLRLWNLDEGALFIDEGESTLNALSILEHGYPADHYLGLPMFENTLTEPWPESSEYEFRDTSYSASGMAVYHGWLPLYAIAASLALAGIGPDACIDPPRIQHAPSEMSARIRAARMPSVWFGGLFVLAMFLTGRILFGVDAGLAAALMAAVAPKCIWLAQQARYYSAGLAFSTLAVYSAWCVLRRGRRRDFVFSAASFVLLFHTSSLAFVLVALSCLVLVPRVWRREGAPACLALWVALVGAGIVPWMLWTGCLARSAQIPMARSLLRFPSDYLVYFADRPVRLVIGTLACLGFALLWSRRKRLPARLTLLLEPAGLPLLFLGTWVVVAFFGFQFLVPAASCSLARLTHLLIVGPILAGAIGLALLARVLIPARSTLVAAGASLAVLAVSGNLLDRQEGNPYEAQAARELVEHLSRCSFSPGTKLYALPYQHFCLTYYTGLPIQSIAPVRREFLEEYPGTVVILETTSRLPAPRWESVQREASRVGVVLDDEQARALVPRLQVAMIRAEVTPLVHRFEPPAAEEPGWFAPVVPALLAEARTDGPGFIDYSRDNPAMFGSQAPLTVDQFWPRFFYRFVDAERRSGANVNYAERMRTATAELLPSTWITLTCPPLGRAEGTW